MAGYMAEYLWKLNLRLIRRENIRVDAGTNDDYLNDEELAADAAINDAFLK